MNREEILNQANKRICEREEEQQGSIKRGFSKIAEVCGVYLCARYGVKIPLDELDVAMLMMGMEMIHVAASDGRSEDSFVDIAGYAACAGEIAAKYWAMMDEED